MQHHMVNTLNIVEQGIVLRSWWRPKTELKESNPWMETQETSLKINANVAPYLLDVVNKFPVLT